MGSEMCIRDRYRSGICVVWTESEDAQAFCELIQQAHLAEPAAIALIYYSSSSFSPQQLIEQFEFLDSDLNYCGCSTCGEISPIGMQERGAVAVLLPKSKFSVLAQSIENVHSAGMNSIAQQASELRVLFDESCDDTNIDNTFAVTLIDGLTYSEESVTAALHRGLGDIPCLLYTSPSPRDS